MRTLSVILVLALTACGGDGGGGDTTQDPVLHAPEISGLKLSPDSALYMEGNGSVPVTVEFSFTDRGRDIETLHVRMSDGTSVAIPISGSIDTVSGTLSTALDVTTTDADGCTVRIWLTDKAGYSSTQLSAAFSVIEHLPEISTVDLSPDSALYMEGDGSVVVTAEITFKDIGRDIQLLWIRMPDGTTIEFNELFATETGVFTEDFTMSTKTVGASNVEFWLVDKTGESSDHRYAGFSVTGDVRSSEWTRRLSGLPYILNDVIWDGTVFIAVGDGGVALTSADGIDWVERETPTDANLHAIAFHGSDIIAVGDGAKVLLSIDNGISWSTKRDSDLGLVLDAVVVNESLIVAGGYNGALAADLILISEDGGDSWANPLSWGAGSVYHFTDLVYRNGLYVAATRNPYTGNNCQGDSIGDAEVRVSIDGEVWNEILLRDEPATSYAILHDGGQFIATGSDSTVFASADGYDWTGLQTPVQDIDYLSAAWDGSKLMAAGRISWCDWMDGSMPALERPIGISSTDGGVTWEIFNIDGFYESRGMAWGDGRFVSVGQSTPVSGEGAIYTTD